MASTIAYTDPTFNQTFDSVFDNSLKGMAMNSKNYGGKDGVGKARSSGRVKADNQISVKYTTSGGTAAVDKFKLLWNHWMSEQEKTATIVLDYGTTTFTMTCIVTDIVATFTGGEAVTIIIATLSVDIMTGVWS